MAEYIRTEEEILRKAPIKVTFGEKEYEIKPLPVLKQQEWRDKLMSEGKAIFEQMQIDSATAPTFFSSFAFVFLQFPKKLIELVFAYSPDLPKDTIINEATEEQFALAFGRIVTVAFPFGSELRMLSQTLGITANFPVLAKSMKLQ